MTNNDQSICRTFTVREGGSGARVVGLGGQGYPVSGDGEVSSIGFRSGSRSTF